MDLKTFIRDIPDFPTKGVMFRDITPLLGDAEALQFTEKALLESLGDIHIDKVVGMESRGFFFAPILAAKLNAGFVPVRKPGKLPGATVREDYGLEYGTDALEIHADSIEKGDKVLIHDDVLATGGTANATCKLVEKLGGQVVQYNFIIHLSLLEGEKKLNGHPFSTLLTY